MISVENTQSQLLSSDIRGTVTLTKPTGLEVGDLMIAIITAYPYLNTLTPPSGWSLIYSNFNNGDSNMYSGLAIFKKIATSSDVSSSNFVFSDNKTETMGGIIFRIKNGDFNKIQLSGDPSQTVSPQSQNNIIIVGDITGDNDSDASTFSNYTVTAGTSVTFNEVYDNALLAGFRNSMGVAWGLYSSNSNITAFNVTATNSWVDTEFKFMLVIGESAQQDTSKMLLMF